VDNDEVKIIILFWKGKILERILGLIGKYQDRENN